MLNLTGYVVRETAAAIAFVSADNANTASVRPLWIPRAKLGAVVEADAAGRNIATAQDGDRVGVPVTLEIDAAFAAKVGAA
jgi:hypothetical protein